MVLMSPVAAVMRPIVVQVAKTVAVPLSLMVICSGSRHWMPRLSWTTPLLIVVPAVPVSLTRQVL